MHMDSGWQEAAAQLEVRSRRNEEDRRRLVCKWEWGNKACGERLGGSRRPSANGGLAVAGTGGGGRREDWQ